ncbi:predicted protein [Streptomyces sp. AA4]|nr:predicted protein [Streptomyces sp. AA4]
MIGEVVKEQSRSDLRGAALEARRGEYEIRRTLTRTGTSLLGMVKHLSLWESRCLGEVSDRGTAGGPPSARPPPSRIPTSSHSGDQVLSVPCATMAE